MTPARIMRRAQLEDRAAIGQLCALIWEGEDYIPDVFDDWVSDPRGQFTVVYEGSQLVALGKLTELAPDEWWLEGLRVHPDHRGRGLARELHEYAVALADRTAQGVLRFATASSNKPVHALAEHSGFHVVSRHYIAQAESAADSGVSSFRSARKAELAGLRRWLAASTMFVETGTLMEEGWSWSALLPQLESLLETGRVVWWTDAGDPHAGLAIFKRGVVEGEIRFWVNYADTGDPRLPKLWRALRHLAADHSASRIRAKPLATPTIAAALADAGWQVELDHTMWVYARALPQPARA